MQLLYTQIPSTVLGIYGPNKDSLPQRFRLLHPKCAAVFMALESTNNRLRVSDMRRSAEESLHALETKSGIQPPAFSGHNFGFSIDIDVYDCMKRFGMNKQQLDEFMEAHGMYCHRIDHQAGVSESWHYNLFGSDAAKYLSHVTTNRAPALEAMIQDIYGSQLVLDSSQVQASLKKLNMYSGDVDGDIGPLSVQGIKAFQRAWELPQTGQADSRTQRTLAFVSADIVIS